MIFETLSSGVSMRGRRLPSRSSSSKSSSQYPCRNLRKRFIVKVCRFRAFRDGWAVVLAGRVWRTTARASPHAPWCATRPSAESCLLIITNKPMRTERKGTWNNFGMCRCGGQRLQSHSPHDRSRSDYLCQSRIAPFVGLFAFPWLFGELRRQWRRCRRRWCHHAPVFESPRKSRPSACDRWVSCFPTDARKRLGQESPGWR